jgi:excisionase family DNA binding protein
LALSNDEKWVDSKVVCDYVGISRATLFTWIAKKNFPAVKAGKGWRFKLAEIDEWLKADMGGDENADE